MLPMRSIQQLSILNDMLCEWPAEVHVNTVAAVVVAADAKWLSVASDYLLLSDGRMPHLGKLRQHHVRHLLVLVVIAGQPCQVVPEFFLIAIIAATRISLVAAVIIAALPILSQTQTCGFSGNDQLSSCINARHIGCSYLRVLS
jgi:hypothetical protein